MLRTHANRLSLCARARKGCMHCGGPGPVQDVRVGTNVDVVGVACGAEPALSRRRCAAIGGRCTRTSQDAAVAHGGAVLDVHPAHHRRGGRDEGVDRRVRGLVEHRQQRPVPVVCRANAVGGHGAAAGRTRAGLPAGGIGGAGGARHAQYPNSSGGVTSVSSYSSSTHGSASTFVARLRHAAARGAARGASRGSARPWAHNKGHTSVRGRTRPAALGGGMPRPPRLQNAAESRLRSELQWEPHLLAHASPDGQPHAPPGLPPTLAVKRDTQLYRGTT